MKFFIDTEFNEEVDPVELISIGVVSEDGREFYAINHEYYEPNAKKWDTAHEWVRQNVRPKLLLVGDPVLVGDRDSIKEGLREFVGDEIPEFWGYVAAYDWFLLCRLFGSFEKMPRRWKPFCYDVKQYAKHAGVAHLPLKFTPEHNALVDARWTKHVFGYVDGMFNLKLSWQRA